MSNRTDCEEEAKESNEYHPVKGNDLDGYWRDYDYSSMEPNPFMARLGLLIMYVVAAIVVTNLVMRS